MKINHRPYRYKPCISSNGLRYSGQFLYKFETDNEFITGKRKEGLHRLFGEKMITVRTNSGFSYKLLPEIGLNELILKSIDIGKTKNGYDKATVTFTKTPKDSWFRSGKESYQPIICTHLLSKTPDKDFNTLWFKPFTKTLSAEQFKVLKRNTRYKVIIQHVEEQWTQNGIPMRYKQGNRMGELIIRIKPEIVSLHDINTQDSEIELNYFKLYTPIK